MLFFSDRLYKYDGVGEGKKRQYSDREASQALSAFQIEISHQWHTF